MLRTLAAAVSAAFITASVAALAQSGCGPAYYGNIPTAAQWNACFQQKQDVLNFTPFNRAGDTMTGRLNTAASSTVQAPLNVPPGAAPTSPVNGDVWTTSTGLYAQVGGQTVLISSTPTRIAFYASVNFNAANTDTTVPVTLPPGFTRYLVASVRISGASRDISTATGGVFTAESGGGSAIVTGGSAITVTNASDATNNNAQSMTVIDADTRSYLLGATGNLYFRVGTAEGAAATATVSISIVPLP